MHMHCITPLGRKIVLFGPGLGLGIGVGTGLSSTLLKTGKKRVIKLEKDSFKQITQGKASRVNSYWSFLYGGPSDGCEKYVYKNGKKITRPTNSINEGKRASGFFLECDC